MFKRRKKIRTILNVALLISLTFLILSIEISAEAIKKDSEVSSNAISYIDTSMEKYDNITPIVEGEPFFYNSVQIRAEKLRDIWQWDYEDDIKPLYQIAKDDGFTVVGIPIWWNEIQPDQMYAPVEAKNIVGETESAAKDELKVRYDKDNEKMASLKYDFSDLGGNISDATIRIFVSSNESGTLKVYGAEDDQHIGDISVDGSHFYDINVMDYIKDKDGKVDFLLRASKDSKAEFTIDLMPEVNDDVQGMDYVKFTEYIQKKRDNGTDYPTTLRVSRDDVYNWSLLDQYIEDVGEVDLKLELLWFGSDTTNLSQDDRLPSYVYNNFQKTIKDDGKPVESKRSAGGWTDYGLYHYHMDKTDPYLIEKEKAVIKDMMNHIAEYNKDNGDKKTVIGAQINNETNAPGRLGYNGRSHSEYANELWEKGGYSNTQDFYFDVRAEWLSDLAGGVKESNYSVWTRANNQYGFRTGVKENEELRETTGTNLDFMGTDGYNTADLGVIYDHLLDEYGQGKNAISVAESDWTMGKKWGSQKRQPDRGILLTYAANGFASLYDLIGPDNHNFYVRGENNTAIPGVIEGEYNSVTVENVPSADDKSMLIKRMIPWSEDTKVVREFDSISGEVTIELEIKKHDKDSWWAIDIGETAAFAFAKNGDFQYLHNGSWKNVTKYEEGKWHELKITFDTNAKKYDLEFDGERLLNDIEIENTVNEISSIEISSNNSNTDTVYVNNVKISDDEKVHVDDNFNSTRTGNRPLDWKVFGLEEMATYDWFTETKNTNHMLQKIWYDIASKRTDGAGGSDLVFFNQFADDTANIEKMVHGYPFQYETDDEGVGIAIRRSQEEFVIASKYKGTFILPEMLNVESASVGYYDHNNQWVEEAEKTFIEEDRQYVFDVESYEVIKITADPLVAKGNLDQAISLAENLLNSISIGNDVGQFSEESADELQSLIDSAKEIIEDNEVIQDDVDLMIEDLNEAVSIFKSSRIMENSEYIYHLYDDFSEQELGRTPVDWDIFQNSGTVQIVEGSDSSNKVVKIEKEAEGFGRNGLEKVIGPLRGKVFVETRVSSDSETWSVFPYLYDSKGEMISTIAFDNGNIKVHTDGDWKVIQPYEKGKYYDLKIVLDIDNNKFDFYIDDELKLEQASFRNAGTDFNKISFYDEVAYPYTLYIDNVKIYQEKEESEVDTSELETLIEKAEEYHADDYTEDSFVTLTDALEASKALIANAEATQAEVDTAKEALQTAINGLEEKPVDVSAEKMRALVERFEEDGAFANELTARSLKTHLTAVDRYEKQEANEKVVKHMQSFKLLLDHQKEVKDISEEAYNALMDRTDSLIKKWE